MGVTKKRTKEAFHLVEGLVAHGFAVETFIALEIVRCFKFYSMFCGRVFLHN